jgi:uncharacterized protein involved in outer membrane biogenesis
MRSRWVLIPLVIAGVLLLLALGPGSIWLNSFVHSDSFRHEVESKISATAGGPVEIKQIDAGVFIGVRLSGVAGKLNTEQGTVAAQAGSIHCSYSLLALLERRLQFNRLTVVDPDVVLTQQPPSTVATPTAPGTTTPASANEGGGQTALFSVVLDSAKISDGHLAIRDTTGATKADLKGVQAAADTSGYYDGRDVTGKLSIATIALPQNLQLTDFSTPFTFRTGAISADPYEASAFGGKLTGDYKLDPTGPSLLHVNGTGLDVAQIGKAASPDSASALSGSLALQSQWHGVETGKLTGEGDAQITGGKLSGVSVLHDLATILQIRDLSDPDLKQISVHFEVANGSTHFSNLRIASEVFDMTGSGVIDPQGRIDANMELTLHSGAMGALPGAAVSLISHLPGGGGSIPFHISGTLSSLHTNLSSNIFSPAAKATKSVSKELNRLFH